MSGPATRPPRPPRSTRTTTRAAAAPAVALPAPGAPLAKVLEALRALPDARWLDRLLRGQGWIILIAIALIGIVAMQVSLLGLNAGIGQSIEQAGSLERQNADLRAEVSRLSSEERIAAAAEKLGLVMPDAGEFRYVTVRGERDARKAAAVMRAPDPAEEPVAAATATATATATAAPPAAETTAAPETTTQTAPPVTPAAEPTQTTTPPAAEQTAPAAGATAGATAAPATATAAPGQ